MQEERKKKRVKVRIKKEKPVKKFIIRNFKYRKEVSAAVILLLLVFAYLAYYVIWKEMNPAKRQPEVFLEIENTLDEKTKRTPTPSY